MSDCLTGREQSSRLISIPFELLELEVKGGEMIRENVKELPPNASLQPSAIENNLEDADYFLIKNPNTEMVLTVIGNDVGR